MVVAGSKSAATPWILFGSIQARLDIWNEVKVEKTKNNPISLPKQTFFRFFNFDGLYFWIQWEFRAILYLILKI